MVRRKESRRRRRRVGCASLLLGRSERLLTTVMRVFYENQPASSKHFAGVSGVARLIELCALSSDWAEVAIEPVEHFSDHLASFDAEDSMSSVVHHVSLVSDGRAEQGKQALLFELRERGVVLAIEHQDRGSRAGREIEGMDFRWL